uniref:Uncharacterized protein n=1 Tax=Hydrodictyon reticulatum TaxID=3107 RepID=A0A1W6F7L7_HYDRE|nr:hypothetical protein [Hydrodictyon reticulatum]ARK36683.1 hypothetical protein [Hydrodictyon reticulatum]
MRRMLPFFDSLHFTASLHAFFTSLPHRLCRSRAKASPKRSEGFTEAEQRLCRSRAKASPKRSEGFTEAERRLHRSGAKASAPPMPMRQSDTQQKKQSKPLCEHL